MSFRLNNSDTLFIPTLHSSFGTALLAFISCKVSVHRVKIWASESTFMLETTHCKHDRDNGRASGNYVDGITHFLYWNSRALYIHVSHDINGLPLSQWHNIKMGCYCTCFDTCGRHNFSESRKWSVVSNLQWLLKTASHPPWLMWLLILDYTRMYQRNKMKIIGQPLLAASPLFVRRMQMKNESFYGIRIATPSSPRVQQHVPCAFVHS